MWKYLIFKSKITRRIQIKLEIEINYEPEYEIG